MPTPATSRPIKKTRLRTKTHAVCDRLTEMAHELGPERKFPTFTQLRDQLGVSVVTLSSALDELEARRVIHRRPGVGIFVSPKFGRQSVALVCEPGFFRLLGTSPFWEILLEETRRRAANLEWEVHYHFANPGTDEISLHSGLLDDIREGRIHGLLSIGGGEQGYAMMEGGDVPFVAYAGDGPYTVVMEPDSGVSLGATLLRGAGCQRIGLWSPVMPYKVMGDPARDLAVRDALFAETLRRTGAALDERLIENNLHLIRDAGSRRQTDLSLPEQGYETARRVFGRDKALWPDGIVSSNDVFTQGIAIALRELGVRLNEDVKIASHANRGSSALLGVERDLYLFEVDPSEIVWAMFRLLEAQMDKETPPEREYIVRARPRCGANVPSGPSSVREEPNAA